VLDHVHVEGAFFQIGIYLVLPQSVQNLLNVLQVFCPIVVEDKNVIQIYNHKGIGEGLQYVIHQPHEGGWGIFQAKGHHQPFEKTFFRLESNLPYIILFYGDLVVVGLHINITKLLIPLEMFKKVINSRNWILIPLIFSRSLKSIQSHHEHDWDFTG